ncbi:MAG: polysaccharide export protein [Candidatus Omnitrophica bacterium]|nr:polysaccharide export protein [Candidatus Omnitrophota bacterium]
MKSISKKRVAAFVLMLALATNQVVYAEPLLYRGSQQTNQQGSQVQDAQSPAVPVIYGTSYDPQFAPYASFMQAPQYSQGGLQQQYGSQAPGSLPYGVPNPAMQNPAMSNSKDPYAASEVSPYSHYSPYIEVVGEGSDYTLGIDDVVTIIVRNQPDFSGRFVVDPEGNIQYNFVGDIPAEGKTKEELKAEIVKRLTRFVRYPELAVMISEYRSKAVYVFGYVGAPGKYAMKGNHITVKEAVVAAGLPRMDGSLKNVYVIRPDKNTQSGKPEKTKVNLDKILNKGLSADDFVLEPGDTIVVHQRYFDKFVNGFSRLIGPVFQSAAVYELAWGGSANGFLRPGGGDN